MKRKDTRYLHIDNEIWQYKVGRTYIVVYNPKMEKILIEKNTIDGGVKHNKFVPKIDGYIKTYAIGPAAIINYIEINILNKSK